MGEKWRLLRSDLSVCRGAQRLMSLAISGLLKRGCAGIESSQTESLSGDQQIETWGSVVVMFVEVPLAVSLKVNISVLFWALGDSGGQWSVEQSYSVSGDGG